MILLELNIYIKYLNMILFNLLIFQFFHRVDIFIKELKIVNLSINRKRRSLSNS